ncbi:MAG: hypothetical protein KDE27_03975 [Planctomycetes bacterium]|nr:hypothetical protein [Planctomycetota bacterium]
MTKHPTAGIVLALTALTAPLRAQRTTATPPAAPGPETAAAIWSPAEAAALANAQRLLVGATDKGRIRLPPGGLRIAGSRILCFARRPDGTVAESESARLRDGLVLLAWPDGVLDTPVHRGVLLHGDGTALCCEFGRDGSDEPSAATIVGRGSEGTFADVVKQPGTSESGDFWYWVSQVSAKVAVEVVDGDGRPRPGVEVLFVPQAAVRSARLDVPLSGGPWPTGTAIAGADGKLAITGPRCAELAVLLGLPNSETQLASGFSCDAAGDGLRVVVTNRAIRRAVASRNESAVIATLKNIASAQAQCQACGAIDADGDGKGEFGFFAELSGAAAVRGSDDAKINPPVLSRAFAEVQGSAVERRGYLFCIFLPDRENAGLREAPGGGGAGVAVAPDAAERLWCAYAWPAAKHSGLRTFFVNQSGRVMACPNDDGDEGATHWGAAGTPDWDAAFVQASGLDGAVATDRTGRNGQRWVVVP